MSPAATDRLLGRERLARRLLAAITLAVLAAGVLVRTGPVLEGSRVAVVLLAGLSLGSLGLLMIGELLGGDWRDPIVDELKPASWTIALVALLALPLAPSLAELYPLDDPALAATGFRRQYFSHEAFLLRSGLCFLLWIGLAVLATRWGEKPAVPAIGLALLAPSVSLASVDWILTRPPVWMTSLFGFAFAVSQLTAALALAFIVNLAQGEHPDTRRFQSLSTALLSLALLTFWVWFVQFLVAWMTNLPPEAAWYLVRVESSPALSLAAVLSLLAAILVLLPFRRHRIRLLVGSALLLGHHLSHMLWLVRPAPGQGEWPGQGQAQATAAAVMLLLAALWFGWLVAGVRAYDRNQGLRQPDPSPAPADGRLGGTAGGQGTASSAPSV